MKISIIADVLGSENNGTTITVRRLINNLKKRGHDVKVVSPSKIDEEGINTIDESILEEIDRLNKKSDELINDVMQELAYRLNKNYFKKYDFINGKSIRIANHTHNPMNGKCDINVVIAEKDLTRSIFATATEDLVFCNNATVNEIVEAILEEANN